MTWNCSAFLHPTRRAKLRKILNNFWATYEIAGVALVDMAVWHWMYDHPQASPQELNQATVQISKDMWNRYYAPVFRKNDVVLLGVYSHMIDAFLYLPDYPIGHLIAFQIEEQMKKAGSIGAEFERMAKMGCGHARSVDGARHRTARRRRSLAGSGGEGIRRSERR